MTSARRPASTTLTSPRWCVPVAAGLALALLMPFTAIGTPTAQAADGEGAGKAVVIASATDR